MSNEYNEPLGPNEMYTLARHVRNGRLIVDQMVVLHNGMTRVREKVLSPCELIRIADWIKLRRLVVISIRAKTVEELGPL